MKKTFQVIGVCVAVISFFAAVAGVIWYLKNRYAICDCCCDDEDDYGDPDDDADDYDDDETDSVKEAACPDEKDGENSESEAF